MCDIKIRSLTSLLWQTIKYSGKELTMTMLDKQKVELRAESNCILSEWKALLDPILERSLQDRLAPILQNSEVSSV
jgi:hypothetical protein